MKIIFTFLFASFFLLFLSHSSKGGGMMRALQLPSGNCSIAEIGF